MDTGATPQGDASTAATRTQLHLDRKTNGGKLMNPLDLVLDPVTAPGVIAAKLWIKGGSSADPQGQRGVHQLLGSLLTRGCGPYDHLALADLVEGCGAGLRCDTHEDGMLISLKCADRDAERLLSLLGWMLIDPHLDPNQVKLERELSLQALQRQREDPFHLAFDGWRNMAYGNGPYGHDPLGFSEDLKQLGREQLFSLVDRLSANSPVLALAGNLPADLEQSLGSMESFQRWSDKPTPPAMKSDSGTTSSQNALSKTNLSLQNEPTAQVVMMLGQPSLSHGHEDDLALRLLNCHLGLGMSSLLFRRLREEHGVAYDVGIHHPVREGAAPFVLHASTSEEKAQLTLQLLLECWWELSQQPLSEEDMALARAKFHGQLAHGAQTTGQRAERRAQLRVLGLPANYDQHSLEEIKNLDGISLQKAAQRHLQTPMLSLCGPEASLQNLAKDWQQQAVKPYLIA
ncbi:MAG: M16 family metallopeptidase [Prochlorococcus sp.]